MRSRMRFCAAGPPTISSRLGPPLQLTFQIQTFLHLMAVRLETYAPTWFRDSLFTSMARNILVGRRSTQPHLRSHRLTQTREILFGRGPSQETHCEGSARGNGTSACTGIFRFMSH